MTRVMVLSVAVSATFASTYQLTNIFPYVGFMVIHFSGGTKEEAGYRAGLLASAFMFSRVPASVVWGFLADRVGRRPVLLLGCWTMFAFQIMFGLAPSFEVAMLARLLMGAFSGVVGTSKTVASELAEATPKEQALAMNIFQAASSVGSIMGPAISGMLYDPASQYPGTWLARLPLVEQYPFLLPNVVASLLALLAGIGTYLFLPETLPNAVSVSSLICQSRSPYVEVRSEEDPEDAEGPTKGAAGPAPPSQDFVSFLRTIAALWRKDTVRAACSVYGFYSFIGIFFSELFPLWLLAKGSVGGFGYDAKTIGMVISASAVLLLGFQVLVFPLVASCFKPRKFFFVVMTLSAVYYTQLPAVALLPSDAVTLVMGVHIAQRGAQNILNTVAFTQANMMVNNSCATHERATVNGLSMGIGSVFKALGPICAGTLFAWSVNNDITVPPLNFTASFFTLALLSAGMGLYAFWVPEALDDTNEAAAAARDEAARKAETRSRDEVVTL